MKSAQKIKAGLILISLVLGIGIGNASGFEGTLDSLNSQNFPFIFLNTRVTDNETAITDLTANNFQCLENGTTQTDSFQVTPPETSGGVRLADIVFLIDTSGSMGNAITEVKNNVNVFADALAVSDVDYRLGLVRFGQSSNGGHPELFNDGNLTDDADQFKGFVSSLSATGGYEPGFLALRMAAQGFNFRPGSQKVFLLISDEDSDDRDKEGTITLMQTNDVVVHTAVSCNSGYSSSDYCDETSVRTATGGQLFGVQGPYSEILDSIVEQTASAYIIRYKSSNPNFDGTERNVECVITRDADQATVSGSYIPGSAPSIELSPQTKLLNQTTLPENSTDAIIRASVTDEAAPFVQSNGVQLYYRASNSGSDYSSTVMNLNGQYYGATIPVVSPPGIDYYLTATDGEQTSSLPSTDPGIHPFQIAVLPNVAPEMNHEPITTASANQPITITATITDTTDSLQEATLKYRRVGELIYKTVEMQNTSSYIFEATIPADEVTEDIEYYLIAKDNFNVASFKATADEPFVIGVEEEPVCGNSTCEEGETFENCYQDCAEQGIEKYFPYYKFSSGEIYFPVSFYFDNDADVENNRENYESFSYLHRPYVYTHTVEDDNYFTIQYWKYETYNDHWLWEDHEHDWDATLFVVFDKNNFSEPVEIRLARHLSLGVYHWYEIEKRDFTHPVVYVAKGSHGGYISQNVGHADSFENGGIIYSPDISNYYRAENCSEETEIEIDDKQRKFCLVENELLKGRTQNEPVDGYWPKEYGKYRDFWGNEKWSDKFPWHRDRWYQTRPESAWNFLEFGVECPVDLHIYDPEGRHVGINYNINEPEIEIPEAFFKTKGEKQYIMIPNPIKGDYRVEIIGTGDGEYDFTMIASEDMKLIEMQKKENVPIVKDEIQSFTVVGLWESPREMKEKAITDLESIENDNAIIQRNIQKAINFINESLQKEYWLDDSHLDPKQGKKVFDCELKAVMRLKLTEKLSHDKDLLNVIKIVNKKLTKADYLLAETIFNETKEVAIENNRFKKIIEKFIAKAEKELAKANEDTVNNKSAESINHSEMSWHFSQMALRLIERYNK
ncbi:MAG: VWA domain-containing protein [Candidatus Pacebacteria bacterium]|nr:VWA domain-containing protein [Candidatus Paceibacterota bacterium]